MSRIEGRPELPYIPPQSPETVEAELKKPRIVGIFTAPKMGAPMESHQSIQAIAEVGLDGDRYALRMGAYSEGRTGKQGRIPDSDRQVSIIALHGIAEANAMLADKGIEPFSPAETRRNLVVDNVSFEQMNNLVGQRFLVGDIEMEGVELCTPCTRPAIVNGRKQNGKDFEEAFENKGGIRARVLNDGTIDIDSEVTFPEPTTKI